MDTKIILTDEERHYLEYIGHHNIDDLIDGVGIGDTPLIMRDDLQYYREHRAQEDEWLHEHEAMEARAKAKAKEWEDQTAYIYALPEDERWDALMSEATNAMDRAEQVGINHLSDVERWHYRRYLRFNLYVKSPNGDFKKPIHANVADFVILDTEMFILNQTAYIYDDCTGVFVPDHKGIRIKEMISGCLEREFIEARTIDAIYALIMGKSHLIISDDQINNRPSKWIHFINGYYDPENDRMIAHDPKYREIHVIPYEFDLDNINCPVFETVIRQMIPDHEDRLMLFQYIAYSMSLDTSAQKFLLICGSGGTGKSTILKLIGDIIGSQNTANISLQGLQERFAPASLYMKQANICADIPLTALDEVDMLKKLTGEDVISAERKNKDHFFFKSYARLFFSANDIPYIAEKTNAFYRRMMILRMDQKPKSNDPDLYDKLRREIPQIIALIVGEYCAEECDLSESTNSRDAVKMARKNSDSIEAFVLDRCDVGDDLRDDGSDLYKAYIRYCDREGRSSVSNRVFYREMEKRGFRRVRGRRNYDLVGVKLSDVIRFPDVQDNVV